MMGPMKGMRDSSGTGMRVNIGGAFRFWYFCRNFCEMKAVMPAEKMLITVPDTV